MSRYIDADKLMENFATATKKFMADKYFSNVKDVKNYIRLIRDTITEQPTADVREVVRGEWIVEGDGEQETWGVCNICNMKQCAGDLNYCPNCGADMRGEDK